MQAVNQRAHLCITHSIHEHLHVTIRYFVIVMRSPGIAHSNGEVAAKKGHATSVSVAIYFLPFYAFLSWIYTFYQQNPSTICAMHVLWFGFMTCACGLRGAANVLALWLYKGT